jgi:hypothetical protein
MIVSENFKKSISKPMILLAILSLPPGTLALELPDPIKIPLEEKDPYC